MPIATPQQFRQMLDAAQAGGYAYPAINVTSIITLNAAMKGFADSKSDGIIQFSTGAGQFASGLAEQGRRLRVHRPGGGGPPPGRTV